MSDQSIHDRITSLVDEEHRLRDQLAAGQISTDEEHARLQSVEADLDRCWDLLRQRDARRAAGQDPSTAQTRPAEVVENYRQ